jgi:hypothetical protein
MAEVIRPVGEVEGAVAHLVVAQVAALDGIIAAPDHEDTTARLGPQDVVHDPRVPKSSKSNFSKTSET